MPKINYMTKEEISLPDKEKLLVFIRESKYDGNLPKFYDDSLFPELKPLIKNWKIIRDEVNRFEDLYGNISKKDNYLVPKLNIESGWNNLTLRILCGKNTVKENIFHSLVLFLKKFQM